MRSYFFVGGEFGGKRYCVRDGVDRVLVPVKKPSRESCVIEYAKTKVEWTGFACEVFAHVDMDALSMLAELERHARLKPVASIEYRDLDDSWLEMNFEEFDIDLAANDANTVVTAKSKANPMGLRIACVGRNFSLQAEDGTSIALPEFESAGELDALMTLLMIPRRFECVES